MIWANFSGSAIGWGAVCAVWASALVTMLALALRSISEVLQPALGDTSPAPISYSFGTGYEFRVGSFFCVWLPVSAGIVVLCWLVFGPNLAALAASGFVTTLVLLAVVDLRSGLLPDILTLPLLWAGLLVNLRGGFVPLPDAVMGAMAGYLILWCVHRGFLVCTGREGLGHGDFKLLAATGAWLGWYDLPGVLLMGAGSGLLVAICLRMIGRLAPGAAICFGPFLATGAITSLFLADPWRLFAA